LSLTVTLSRPATAVFYTKTVSKVTRGGNWKQIPGTAREDHRDQKEIPQEDRQPKVYDPINQKLPIIMGGTNPWNRGGSVRPGFRPGRREKPTARGNGGPTRATANHEISILQRDAKSLNDRLRL
jgi:hypothetical protein